MHVKEQVKEFVHDVKRKFSKKHNRDSTCPSCATDNHDGASSYSSADTYGTEDDSLSSSDSSLPGTPRRRLISFLHRAPSSPPMHHHHLPHHVKRVGSKRYRLFSAPSVPSMRAVDASQSSHRQVATDPGVHGSVWRPDSVQDTADGSETIGYSQEDFPDVIDISARSINTDTVVPDESIFRDSGSQSQPQFDADSETSGTLITAASSDFKKSVSDSDSPSLLNLLPDENPAPLVSFLPSIVPMQDPNVPPAPPPKSEIVVPAADADDEEIALVQSTSSPAAPSSSPHVVPQASRAMTPAQPIRSTSASPMPAYIPRLTAPSMFLPIPNVRVICPLSHPLVWWLAPRWSLGVCSPSSVSTLLPRFGNGSPFLFRQSMGPHFAFSFPLYSNFLPPPPRVRR